MQSTVLCRRATEADVEPIYTIIEQYAAAGIMLPRSKKALSGIIDSFVVAEADGKVVGCGSLCRLGADLAEIRSLGIVDGYKGKGIGRKLVDRLLEDAAELKIPKVMALTYEVAFFEKLGFAVVDKEIFPEKVWTDCVHCPKRNNCDEIAVLKRLA